jgi:hypothetical protein
MKRRSKNMAIPGLLIEYLFNGSIALAWLYPLFSTYFDNVPAVLLPFVVVALYLVGMVIDVVAWALTRPLKRWLRRPVHRKYTGSEDSEAVSGTLRQAKIALHAPDLARELAMRSSRDRIARGAIVNAILAAIFVLPWWAGLPVVIVSVIMWSMFEKLSYMYELCAEKVVDEKN